MVVTEIGKTVLLGDLTRKQAEHYMIDSRLMGLLNDAEFEESLREIDRIWTEKENKVSVLIFSCDSYSDVWGPFFTLFFRYWDCPYKVYLAAETEQCLLPEVKTINEEADTWTERIRKCVEELPSTYVICMCEDMFFRRPVKQDMIDTCIQYMDENPNIACFNFEKEYGWYEPSDYPDFGRKPDRSAYRNSCQPSIWRKSILEEMLSINASPWEWETSTAENPYEFYVFTGEADDLAFEYGYHNNKWFGIQKGRWVIHDVLPLFKREGIDIDYSIRGIV